MLLPELRRIVSDLLAELPKNNLVAWTSGNISTRDPESGLVVIKPSGIKFRDLTPESMVVVSQDGKIVEGDYKASSDTASHCCIYRQMPAVNGIVHTHSRYATAFATLGRSMPCVTTAMGDEFGSEIPCGGFGLIGGCVDLRRRRTSHSLQSGTDHRAHAGLRRDGRYRIRPDRRDHPALSLQKRAALERRDVPVSPPGDTTYRLRLERGNFSDI
jgi:ribulose-5-phosphate 4-epimerase/fuculose-1-phosphate aldolase